MGVVTYDPVAQTVDPHPISIPALAGWLSSIAGSGMAAIAVWRGWGKK